MSEHLHNELKKEFQLERFVLFSDAVFAIAITLLVIELKVPEIGKEISEDAVLAGLARLVPKFIGFFFSFFLIGLYWTVHHRMFGFLVSYTPQLLWLNLGFLLAIVLMPFSTAFYSDYSQPETIKLITPLVFYVANLWLIGIMNFALWAYIGNPSKKVAEGLTDRTFLKVAKLRSVAVPMVFTLVIPAAMVLPGLARFVPMLIPVVMKLIQKYFERRSKKQN